MNKNALVTGASAGIGATFAKYLAQKKYNLILVARREERLRALADELAESHGVRCELVAADLTDAAAPSKVIEQAESMGMPVDFLVNNAGLSGNYRFAETDWDELAGEIQVMITAVTELAHRSIPGMKQRGGGHIINLSSIAAFMPPGASLLYTGIKAYVLYMSESLNMELKPQGIHVTALCPGFTHSEFHDAMGTRSAANNLPGILWQEPDAVVREGYAAVMAGRPVCVPGRVNKLMTAFMRPVPEALRYQIGKSFNPFQ